MSGHSKWSQIKRQKGVADAKRGQVFTKVAREIIVAVRQGGGANPEANARLRLAIQKARDNSMPIDNIERAIKRGSGEAAGAALSEVIFEGYGPGGVAILVEVVSDNRNRTLQEVRHVFSRNGGNLGESGSVSWVFAPKGIITIDKIDAKQAEEVALLAIDAGADDVRTEKTYLEIHTTPQDMEALRKTLERKKLVIASAEIAMVPKTMVQLDEKAALQTLKLLDQLEDLDDVQHVYSNADFSDTIMEKYRTTILAGSK